MAPPAGTLRVGRYFAALAVIFAILYALVAFGSTHKPKLGLDLVGGLRVVFTAQTPQGSPAPTSSQMTQARQILENRINGTGVTGSTVQVQNGNQLVVEIPNGTSTDLATLGQAAVLNFRGVVAPVVQTTCVPSSVEGTGSASASPSGSSGASSTPGATSSGSASASASPSAAAGSTSASASNSGAAASERPLAKASSGTTAAATSKAASSKAASSKAASSAASSAASPSGTASGTASGSASASPSASPTAAPAPTACLTDPFTDAKAPAAARALKSQLIKLYKVTKAKPTIWDVLPNAETCPSPTLANASCRAYSALSSAQQSTIATALQSFDCTAGQAEPDTATGAYYACQGDQRKDGSAIVFLLGHVIVKGTQIDSADAQAPNTSNGGGLYWTIALKLTSSGGNNWSKWTGKYNTGGSPNNAVTYQTCTNTAGSECSQFVAFTLNGEVISAPQTQAVLDINTSVSGNFTESQAKSLAQQLDYGKLPVSFRADDTEEVSATLGNSQLEASFVAGGIGLVLVVLYSLIYYRGLGLVTVASLIVSAGLTYALLVILGKQLGFTLDLAGIAGFIVALGITADSFVVFFERLKDEVHEGRSARVAVPRAWIRARRTILSADTVSFLAAAILYFFASADVKGFAFTLGMSTVLDLVVVFLFTHPLVALLSRSAAFGSSRFTGLDAVRGTRTPIADLDAPPRTRGRKSAGTTAVVDHRTEIDEETEREVAPDPAPDLTKRSVTPETESVTEEDPDEPETPRRRVTPESGTAAERAAARRARLRQQKNDGTSGDEN